MYTTLPFNEVVPVAVGNNLYEIEGEVQNAKRFNMVRRREKSAEEL